MNDRQRLEAIISVVCKYLPPDGIHVNVAMSEIISSLVDPLPPLLPVQLERPWVGLTDEDRKQISKEANYHWEMTTGEYAERIGQLTEAKLKEKNT